MANEDGRNAGGAPCQAVCESRQGGMRCEDERGDQHPGLHRAGARGVEGPVFWSDGWDACDRAALLVEVGVLGALLAGGGAAFGLIVPGRTRLAVAERLLRVVATLYGPAAVLAPLSTLDDGPVALAPAAPEDATGAYVDPAPRRRPRPDPPIWDALPAGGPFGPPNPRRRWRQGDGRFAPGDGAPAGPRGVPRTPAAPARKRPKPAKRRIR